MVILELCYKVSLKENFQQQILFDYNHKIVGSLLSANFTWKGRRPPAIVGVRKLD